MIRLATRSDIPAIFTMLRHYRDAGGVKQYADFDEEETPRNIMTYIFAGAGVALLNQTSSGDLDGMLLAIKTPHLWNNTQFVLSEICYWVEPAARGGRTGYRLLQRYCEYGDELKESGQITHYTLSQMAGTSLNYSRFGFTETESTWSQ